MNTVVRTTIDETVKQEADAVLSQLGLSVSDVVRMTLARVAQDKALPFELKVPNRNTKRALREARLLMKSREMRFSSGEAMDEALNTDAR